MNEKEKSIRTELLIGSEGIEKLKNSRVAVFGAGGVGGAVIEALARAGIGKLIIVDNDTIAESNLNRQILALYSTLGIYKTEAAKKRVMEINPECEAVIHSIFADPRNIRGSEFNLAACDYIVDAIDNVTAKIELAVHCEENNIKLISSMGTGNKLNPLLFKIGDIYETSVCPLARVMRRELNKRGVKALKVLYSTEKPLKSCRPPGSISFVPPTAGFIIAGEVVNDLLTIR